MDVIRLIISSVGSPQLVNSGISDDSAAVSGVSCFFGGGEQKSYLSDVFAETG